MFYVLQHFSDAPILLLECPLALDFYPGLAGAERYMNDMIEELPASERIYLIIHIPDSRIYADVFVDFLKTRTLKGELLIYNRRVKIVVTGDTALRNTVTDIFANQLRPIHIPTFNSVNDASDFCYRDYQGMLSVKGA